MLFSRPGLKGLFLASTAVVLAMGAAAPVVAQTRPSVSAQTPITIAAQPLGSAIQALSERTGVVIVATGITLNGRNGAAVTGATNVEQALTALLRGTGLAWRRDANGAYAIFAAPRSAAQDAPVTPRRRPDTPAPVAAADPEASTLEEIVVTARRREERIIDVPVAVSAFSEERLEDLRIEGGSELLRAIPNVNFSKDNFTGYNFSIRGVGTKAASVTTDPGVAVSFNNSPLLRNRLFEQEYFDISRLEVLRGPQGTLYGRNATSGVVNMLPNLPELGDFYGSLQAEVGNYDTRRMRGHVNIPIGDTLAVRFAGAMTQRDGFDYNTVTEQSVNGRELWATRVGVLWEPTSNFRANFLWEHFNEDDDRSRTGKMLCTRGETPSHIDWTDPNGVARQNEVFSRWTSNALTPGCQAESLYGDNAYGAPNGLGFPIVLGMIMVTPFTNAGTTGHNDSYLFRMGIDPFGTTDGRQSTDLREIATTYDPVFRAENDVFQLNMELDLTPNLSLFSQTLYTEDSYYGSQDFFRMQGRPDLMARKEQVGVDRPPLVPGVTPPRPGTPRQVSPAWQPWLGDSTAVGGVFLDPQLGATDRMVAIDISQSESSQFSQEFRLQSSFEGPFNFNLGANYLKFETEENYYVISNAFTIAAIGANIGAGFDGSCNPASWNTNPNYDECVYIDPNPIDRLDGEGHNYFRSLNIARTESWSVFGEGYYEFPNAVRATLGLRYTNDKKTLTPVPTQLFGSANKIIGGGGGTGRGYPRDPDIVQNWGEWSGRLALDWRPDLSFTEDTLAYASYSRGYKAGGANPAGQAFEEGFAHYAPLDQTFDAEFVNAYEIGVKNTLDGGRLMLNATAFFYDYTDYQVAQAIDRLTHNENFDARAWGLEVEAAWTPTRNFRLDATLGLLRTRIANGEKSVDVMNRTQGNDDWMVMRPWPTSPATCIVPKDIIGRISNRADWRWSGGVNTGQRNVNSQGEAIGQAFIQMLCPSPTFGTYQEGFRRPNKPISEMTAAERARYIALNTNWRDNFGDGYIFYDPLTDAPNQGRGFDADLSGNELPNAPRWTFNLGAQHRFELPGGWDLTVRGDYYRQSDSWMRVYNLRPYDRLKGWGNANMAITLTNPDSDLLVQAYVKNVFDSTPITDGYTGPDELGNFTNVFTLDPRIIGLSVRKSF